MEDQILFENITSIENELAGFKWSVKSLTEFTKFVAHFGPHSMTEEEMKAAFNLFKQLHKNTPQ